MTRGSGSERGRIGVPESSHRRGASSEGTVEGRDRREVDPVYVKGTKGSYGVSFGTSDILDDLRFRINELGYEI